MLNLGFSEISLIAVMALLLFGPEKMPEFAKTVARFVKEFRRMSAELQSTVHETVATIDSDTMRAPSLREVYDRVDPKRAIEEIGIRPFADPAPDAVEAPPAQVSAYEPDAVGQAMSAPSIADASSVEEERSEAPSTDAPAYSGEASSAPAADASEASVPPPA